MSHDTLTGWLPVLLGLSLVQVAALGWLIVGDLTRRRPARSPLLLLDVPDRWTQTVTTDDRGRVLAVHRRDTRTEQPDLFQGDRPECRPIEVAP